MGGGADSTGKKYFACQSRVVLFKKVVVRVVTIASAGGGGGMDEVDLALILSGPIDELELIAR